MRFPGPGSVLYLADNAGETVFDRLLIETLDAPVLYAVKSGPVLNDATRDDALAAGVDRVADIVTTGSGCSGDDPGPLLRGVSTARTTKRNWSSPRGRPTMRR